MKNYFRLNLLFVLLLAFVPFLHGNTHRTIGEVERLDPAINKLIPENAKIEILAEGYDWSEGPVWISNGNFLLFSDVPANKVYKWKEGEGVSLYLNPSGYTSKFPRAGESGSNGLTLNAKGQLILCQHGDRRIARMMASTSLSKVRVFNSYGSLSWGKIQ